VKMRPWMIEAAFDYIRGSRLLFDNGRPGPGYVNAAIGLEILLKSFLARVDGPEGGIGEQYVFDKKGLGIKSHAHNLLQLFDLIPADVRELVGLDETYRSWIEDYFQEPFLRARYPYEPGATASYSDVLTQIAGEMLHKVVRAYIRQGCDDPWFKRYPDC
jgi:hypothetical protein